ncbi:MAG: MFS transporter [Meiothermus sp.]|nr:MFS transporter [Meiothermus sp.]
MAPTARSADSFVVRATLLAASMLTIMSGATIAPALPAMQERFKHEPGSELEVRLVLTIIGLAIAVFSPLVGWAADRYGRKPLLLFSLALYALAGVSGFFAQSVGQLLIGRVILGLAVAGTMNASSALIADYFQGAARNRFVGLQSAFTGFGGVVFLPLGGILAGLDWHYPFLVYLASLLILPTALAALYEPPKQAAQPGTAGSLPASVWPLYLLAFAGMVLFYVGPANGPFRLQRDFGVSASQTGFLVAFMTLVTALTALQYSRVRSRLEFPQISGLGLLLMGLGWVVVGLAPGIPVVLLGFVLVGLGAGLHSPNISIWLMSLTRPDNRGRVLGGLTGAIFLGQFVSPILTQPLVQFGLGTTFWAVGLVCAAVGAGMLARAAGLGVGVKKRG